MFKRVLIANRGEIAVRILRCLRELNIESVVVYSEADRESLPVMLAGKAVCIGPASAKESYLNGDILIETALKTGCDALHPGYGFLSENADFAKKCEANGIVFIGPSADIIEKMGDKQTARRLMMENDVPVVPGSKDIISTEDEALDIADKIGYPVLIKASAGGGGKGMRKVFSREELVSAYNSARSEARAAFGNDSVYLEKLIINPHHIEVQIIADKKGNVVHLGERECSIQKNNQKMLEESPSWFLKPDLKEKIGEAAIKAARASGYYSVGTVEFVVDNKENFYFIEMNTRVQVEHPVTEFVTGIDIIKEQIGIAEGKSLSFTQKDIVVNGSAIECRINALSTGKISCLHFPAGFGVRVDSHLFEGYEVSPYYDSMLAKIIVYGSTRLEAIRRMRRALEELVIDGVKTTAELMYMVMYQPEFISGQYDTGFYEKNKDVLAELVKQPETAVR